MTKVAEDFQSTLEEAFTHALSHLKQLDTAPVAATAELDRLRSQLAKTLERKGIRPEQVVRELVQDVSGGLLGSASGRFFGWVIGGTLPAAVGADWLTSIWQQNGAMYACSPAESVVEETVGTWLKEILNIPAAASFALVSGCQMAHVTCLAAARHSLLTKRGWDIEADGLFGAPRIRILSSTERHGSIERAVRLLGLGRSAVEVLPIDEEGRLVPDRLEQALRAVPDAPTIVLLQAGDINIGAYDCFADLIPIAKRFGAWVHVDGAFGLWAAASSQLKYLIKDVDQADSWATDGHKWLNVPFDCGFAFVADAEAHRGSLAIRASYLTHATEARDQVEWNPEWSRRSRGFAAYATLRQLGRDGLEELIDRCCRHAKAIVNGIGELPGAEVLWEPVINQGLVRFPDPAAGATEADHDRNTDRVIAEILKTGEAFFGGTTWRGQRAMRVSVCNWRTSEADVERVVNAVAKVLKKL